MRIHIFTLHHKSEKTSNDDTIKREIQPGLQDIY